MHDPFPEIADLVPHAGPMCLLERIVSHDDAETCCEANLAAPSLLRGGDGAIPSWMALEYMAQGIAVHAGLLARAAGEPPRVGFIASCPELRLHVPNLGTEGRLLVRVRYLRGRPELGALSFACFAAAERDGETKLLAEGRISIALQRSG